MHAHTPITIHKYFIISHNISINTFIKTSKGPFGSCCFNTTLEFTELPGKLPGESNIAKQNKSNSALSDDTNSCMTKRLQIATYFVKWIVADETRLSSCSRLSRC